MYADGTAILNFKTRNEKLEIDAYVILKLTAKHFNNVGFNYKSKRKIKTTSKPTMDKPNPFVDYCLVKDVTHNYKVF